MIRRANHETTPGSVKGGLRARAAYVRGASNIRRIARLVHQTGIVTSINQTIVDINGEQRASAWRRGGRRYRVGVDNRHQQYHSAFRRAPVTRIIARSRTLAHNLSGACALCRKTTRARYKRAHGKNKKS